MPAIDTNTTGPNRRRRLFRLGWILVSLVALLVAGWFVATSNTFFQRVVLPSVSRSLDATVTVSHASIRPFSRTALLRGLTIQSHGEPPALVVQELWVRYRLIALLSGQIDLEEAVIESPILRIVRNADGTCNLDPILTAIDRQRRSSDPTSAPLEVDVRSLVVNRGSIDYTQANITGDTFRMEIPDLDLELAGIKNGQTARFTLTTRFAVHSTSRTILSQVAGTLKGDFKADLADDLTPDLVQGEAELAILTATGGFADTEGLTTTLKARLSSTDIHELNLYSTRQGAAIGAVTATGPFNLRTREGRLLLAVNGVGSEMLSLIGGRYGVSFAETKVTADCALDLEDHGKRISAVGSLRGADCSLTRGARVTPTVDFQLDYNLAVDLPGTQVVLGLFTVNATQNGRPLLQAALTRETRIDWGPGAQAIPPSSLDLELTRLDLAEWQVLMGDIIGGGILNAKLGLGIQVAGRLVTFDLASELSDLSIQAPGHRVQELSVGLATRGQLTEFRRMELTDFSAQASRGGEPVISITGSGEVSAGTLDDSLLPDRLELRQVRLALTPTDRAGNELQLSGQFDRSSSNTLTGRLKIEAESLDLTSYYAAYEARAASPSASPSKARMEPPAFELPFHQTVCTLDIARLYLRELAISDLLATAKLDGAQVKLDPVSLTLNGAPASARMDLNLGLPGYEYSIEAHASEVPLAPLVNTFQPDRQGQMSGSITTLAQVTGAGITGPNLRKNLTAQFDIGTTNLNLELIDVRGSLLKSVVNTIISLPDILRNPSAELSGILQRLSGSTGAGGGGWIDEVSTAPIDVVLLRGQAGQGRIEVQHALVQSLTFQVETRGQVTLADSFTNSPIEFPVAIALRRSLAEQIGQVTAQTPVNAHFVKLPAFLTMLGTVGAPSRKLDYPALAQMAVKLGVGLMDGGAQAAVDQVTGTLGGLADALGARGTTQRNVSTNAVSPGDILGRFLPRPPAATNVAPASPGPSP
jgi:hypothetical protein